MITHIKSPIYKTSKLKGLRKNYVKNAKWIYAFFHHAFSKTIEYYESLVLEYIYLPLFSAQP